MNHKRAISEAIRTELDSRGIEISWADIDAAAERILEVLEGVFEAAWMYDDLADS